MSAEKGLPQNWKERIANKKVILYLTSLGNMLNSGMQHIEKIEYVLETFRRHQEEVVLWWRPHPLEISTLESMRPDLLKKYMEIRKRYEEETWGILDTSADVHRAIAISDAYYGDYSSVVQLYEKTGKPILMSSDSVKEIVPTMFLPIATVLKGDYLWFIQLNSNKLVKVHKETMKTERIFSIPGEPSYKFRGYSYHMVDCGNQLVILLGDSKRIYVLDLETERIETVETDMDGYRFRSEAVVIENDKIWLLPNHDNRLLTYSIKERKLQEIFKLEEKVRLSKTYEQVENIIYTINKDSNVIYKIDIENNQYTSVKVGDDLYKYWGIKKAGDFFVLPHTNGKAITLWNEEKGEVVDLTEFPSGYDCLEGQAYLSMYSKNESVYITPFYANMLLKIDTMKTEILSGVEKDDLDTKYCDWYKYGAFLLDSFRCGNCIYGYAMFSKIWYVIDLNTMLVKKGPEMEIETSEIRDTIENIFWDENDDDESFTASEQGLICTLDNYIQNVKKYIGNSRSNTKKIKAGVLIHQHMMEIM